MNMIRHNFHTPDCEPLVLSDFQKDGFQSFVNFAGQYITAIFHTPNEMVIDVVNGCSSMYEMFVGHEHIVQQLAA